MLVSAPGGWSASDLGNAIGLPEDGKAAWIGSHAERFSLA
jgi:hypothetical protein